MELRDGVKPRKVRVFVVDVRQDDIPAQDLANAVKNPGFDDQTRSVVFTFADPQPEVGTYDVTVQLRQGRERQLVTFELVRETADIKTIASLSVEEEEEWSFLDRLDWFGDLSKLGGTSTPTLKLRVGAHDSVSTSDISVAEIDSDKGTVTGDLKAVTGGFEYVYELSEMPLGTSQQTLEFSSPQLTTPVTVTLNVTHRRPLALIGMVVLVGLFVGAAVRRWLEPTIAKYEARLVLADVVRRITEAMGRADLDAATKAKLEKALAAASGISRYATAQTILAKAQKAEDLMTEALTPAAAGRGVDNAGRARRAVTQAWEKTEGFRFGAALFVLKWARAVLLSVFLFLAAYALYADTWTGSWQQLVIVASWAFALDITTEAVTKQFNKAGPGTA